MPKADLPYPIHEERDWELERDKSLFELQTVTLTAFFDRLNRERHYIYALCDSLPKPLFSIVRYSGYIDELCDRKSFTLREFIDSAATFHSGDYFYILFAGLKISYVEELDDNAILKLYAGRVKLLCERRMRKNHPVVLSPSVMKRYGLTEADAECIEPLISACNASAAAKLQTEYDTVKTLDCIHK